MLSSGNKNSAKKSFVDSKPEIENSLLIEFNI